MENNKIILFCWLIAFSASTVFMPLAIKISSTLGAMSDIGSRHVGRMKVARLGGLGVLFGITVAIGFAIQMLPIDYVQKHDYVRKIIGLSIGLFIVSGVGFWDDVKRLSASTKVILQIFAGLVVHCFGLRVSGIDIPFIAPVDLGYLSIVFTIGWVVFVVNAVNLIDGLDGLAGGVILFASIVNLVSSLVSNAIIPALFMSSLAGATFGFLMFNWYPAKIYLGDGGAYSAGFLLACSALLAPLQKASTGVALLIPILATGLPIMDTSITIIRRFMKQKKIFTPDRGHIHHLLLDSGISHRRVVIGLYLVSMLFGSLAILIVLNRNRVVGVTLLGAVLFGSILWGVTVRRQLAKIFGNKNIRRT
jgi:UDP-GlcNAc:undecaprenyl-phosphate GlcNAc-1-phosphate transferase